MLRATLSFPRCVIIFIFITFVNDQAHTFVYNGEYAHARGLSTSDTSTIGTFSPLDCNNDLNNADCTLNKVSTIVQADQVLEIPCGECWEWDLIDTTVGGIIIKGKLIFPLNHKALIYTNFIIVEGELHVEVSHTAIKPENVASRFILTGTDETYWVPTDTPNIGACQTQQNMQCNLGKKPFFVAGGRLNIRGISSSCENFWTNILGKEYKKPEQNPEDFDTFQDFPGSCSVAGFLYVNENFNDSIDHWSCQHGCLVLHDNFALVAYNRVSTNQGPSYNLSHLLPKSCLEAGREYLLHARIKLDKAGALIGEETTCKSTGTFCPRLVLVVRDNQANQNHYQFLAFLDPNDAGEYGELFDFTDKISFSENMLNLQDATYTLYFEGPEGEVNVTIDDFTISIPNATSYPPENDFCENLILNGAADDNGFHPFPIRSHYNQDTLTVMEENNGNKYFRLSNRVSFASSVTTDINSACLVKGTTYFASFDVRIHSTYDQAYFIQFEGSKDDGSMVYKKIVECPGQNINDDWVTCSGEFLIDEDVSEATAGAYFHLYMENSRDGNLFVLDFDNMMLTYMHGYVNSVVVASDDVSCWGTGSQIHISSSTYYSFGEDGNGYVGTISDIVPQNDGTTHLTLSDPPVHPIITEEDDLESAAVVALLSRNVKIEGEGGENNKGAYMQIMHTPNLSQIVEGVEFGSMGRNGEDNRYPIQFRYCGSIQGSSVSKNSFIKSNNRCVVLDGTSNCSVSQNVAYKCVGNCFHIGYRSEDNSFTKNVISETVGNGFFTQFPQNHFVDNAVVASSFNGFNFQNSYVRNENGSIDYSVDPSLLTLGTFVNNVAASSGNIGMYFNNFQSSGGMTLIRCKSLRNKNYGLAIYYGFRFNIIGPNLFEGNGVGIELVNAEHIEIVNTKISGLSELTKKLVKPVTWADEKSACDVDGFLPPIGYRTPTKINMENNLQGRGAALRNVSFVDFDNEECIGSFPISFNTEGTDLHWSYVSTFENVTFDTNHFMDGETAISAGINDIVITDVNGMFDPSGEAHSSFVSNTGFMKAFQQGECANYDGYISYCKGLCLRSLSIYIDQTETIGWYLNITELTQMKSTFFGYIYQHDDDSTGKYLEQNKRRFAINLPLGTYIAQFHNANADVAWPRFAFEDWEGTPQCGNHANGENLVLHEPEEFSCSDLVDNGSFIDDSTSTWLSNTGEIEILSSSGISSSKALKNTKRTDFWKGPGQNLDSRCFSDAYGELFEVKVWFRLEWNDGIAECDPSTTNSCPIVKIDTVLYTNEITKESLLKYSNIVATTMEPFNSGQFNLIHGVFEVDDSFHKAKQVFFYVGGVDTNFDITIDDISIKPLQRTLCESNLIQNGDVATGFTSFWKSINNAKLEVVNINGNYVVKVSNRQYFFSGVRMDIFLVDCLRVHDRYALMGSFKIKDSSTGDIIKCKIGASHGSLDSCSTISVISSPSNEGSIPTYTQIGKTAISANNELNDFDLMSGIYVVSEHHIHVSELYIRLDGPHQNYDVIYDEISVTPMKFDCSDLIVNSNFDDGTSLFWAEISGSSINIDIMTPGAAEGGYALLLQSGISQSLDTRCFQPNFEYVVAAKFRLLDGAHLDALTGLECNPNIQNVHDHSHCPNVRLVGYNCALGEIIDLWNNIPFFTWDSTIFNSFQAEFTVSTNLATCGKVEVQVGFNLAPDVALVVDDIHITALSTFAPTSNPTYTPTIGKDMVPTSKPIPTTSSPSVPGIFCPQVDEGQVEISMGPVMIFNAVEETLCTLTKIGLADDGLSIDTIISVARSYDNSAWEAAPGNAFSSFFDEDITCYVDGCQMVLPSIEANAKYILSSYTYVVSEREELARFLESATFGTTQMELDAIESINLIEPLQKMSKWIENQMDETIVPTSFHRAFWRKRVNARLPTSVTTGTSDHPCYALSRWRRVAFVHNDVRAFATKQFHVTGDGPYVLYLNSYPRTIVEELKLAEESYSDYTFDPNVDYDLCTTFDMDRGIGGDLSVKLEDGSCRLIKGGNPSVNFTGFEELPSFVINLGDPNKLHPIDTYRTSGENVEFLLMNDINDAVCNDVPSVTYVNDKPVFGLTSDGTWFQFDPRLKLRANIPSTPLPDGGKSQVIESGGVTSCANSPRTFLNEFNCELKSNACNPMSKNADVIIDLNNTSINNLHDLTGRYVYAINGLSVIDGEGNEIPHPCTPGLRSRWELRDVSECNPSPIFSATKDTLVLLLMSSTDANPFVRDIYFPKINTCDPGDTFPNLELLANGQCWKRVHQDHLSIFDLTYWAANHPGGSYHIKKWLDDFGSSTLIFPSIHPTNTLSNHPITRWDNNYHIFSFIGRLGDKISILDLPSSLRTDEVFKFFDVGNANDGSILVCGSPNEVANDPTKGFVFDLSLGSDMRTAHYYSGQDRGNFWMMIAIDAGDQLRQRVSFALSQFLVVVPEEIRYEYARTEIFANYYDIFVRNAFGNYRDILREISYSPLMAENLSFIGSKSSAYLWELYQIKAQADENFAREVMQLFTIGYVLLNEDGTLKRDDKGMEMLAYNNDDIMSFSRAWTGFDHQPLRGNIEFSDNRIDPMRIVADWRDRFPKTVWNGYIGDGFPLCIDFPYQHFLRKGATYKIIGTSEEVSVTKLILDDSSNLKDQLCNQGNDQNTCSFSNSITLQNKINCTGDECKVDTVRVVQVTESLLYEYIHPPCVQFSFYNNAKKLNQQYRTSPNICGNPHLPEASEACCESSSPEATRHNLYDEETMTYDSAKTRCTDNSRTVCDFNSVLGDYIKNAGFFWTTDDCIIRVKVNEDGFVTVVHEPSDYSSKVLHIDDSNDNYFKVFWEKGEYPMTSSSCDGLCLELSDSSCLCNTKVSISRVFSQMPSSISEILSNLHIGAVDPSLFDDGTYSSFVDSNTNITLHYKESVHDTETVYEFIDEKGRKQFLKNVRQKVLVFGTNNIYTGYSFRNTPQFNSFIPSQTSWRNARDETEATLDKYFYHDNLAPFISTRLIKLLVSSNPSPRYVREVANAFKQGAYGSFFGTGNYGDMAATVAAIFLDREARNIVLDMDPTHGMVREPLLKVTALMRNMEFQNSDSILRVIDVEDKIGQMAFNFPSVFSFFSPYFQPPGRIRDSGLVSPESQLLDMPKTIGLVNGLISLVKYGLSACDAGLGWRYNNICAPYLESPGHLTFNRTSELSEFAFETFEGPSLNGGFDNEWVGFQMLAGNGEAVPDPNSETTDVTNHVLHFTFVSDGFFYSPKVTNPIGGVKFRYYASSNFAGGCIGYVDGQTYPSFPLTENWIFCDVPDWGQNMMDGYNQWISCQFVLSSDFDSLRIAIADRYGNPGDAYFDDIQLDEGVEETTCTGVAILEKDPPGVLGHSQSVVDNLALLLTSGRLSSESRELIADAFDKSGSHEDGLRTAQQLIVTSPEFHSTNLVKATENRRESFTFPQSNGRPYRAVVYVMLSGGCDSFNMLTPHTCTKSKDLFSEYLQVRQNVALPKSILLPIDASGSDQICETFGVHPDLPILRDLYDTNDLLFFANTGVLTELVNKTNFDSLTKTQLFAHNTMQYEAKRLDPNNIDGGSGIIGRMTDALQRDGSNVGVFSIDVYSEAMVGTSIEATSPIIVNSYWGIPDVYLSPSMKDTVKSLHNTTEPNSGFFGETWSEALLKSLDINEILKEKVESSSTHVNFPDTSVGAQLEMISKLISTREDRGVDKDFFYVEIYGFDTHNDVEERLSERFVEMNEAFNAFQSEMKHPEVDLWSSVAIMQVSDFARTLNPNSGDGTDHAWGGNYFLMGGDVKGGEIKGTYPDDFTDEGINTLGRGRFIPTLPFESCFRAIALWTGVKCEYLCDVCVNCISFPSSILFEGSDLFASPINGEFCDYSMCDTSATPSATASVTPSATASVTPSLTSIHPSLAPSQPSALKWVQITFDDFEKGSGSYKSRGGDARRYYGENPKKAKGQASFKIQDNSKGRSSFVSKDLIDVSEYSEVRIIFEYIVWRFAKGELFRVKYRSDGKRRWQILQTFEYKKDFLQLKRWYDAIVTLDTSNLQFIKVGFFCDASSNRDKVFIDNIYVEGLKQV